MENNKLKGTVLVPTTELTAELIPKRINCGIDTKTDSKVG